MCPQTHNVHCGIQGILFPVLMLVIFVDLVLSCMGVFRQDGSSESRLNSNDSHQPQYLLWICFSLLFFSHGEVLATIAAHYEKIHKLSKGFNSVVHIPSKLSCERFPK